MRSPVGQGRERLMQALFDEFGGNGPASNLSMRQIAERMDVHHTLLTYHFGSRPGLLAAVLSEARRRDNLVFATTKNDFGFTRLCRSLWSFYSNEAVEGRSRGFFHLAGLAVYDREAFDEFISDIDELANLLNSAALRDGHSKEDAQQQSIIAIAGLRGLLLQKLLTPSADIDAAAERFISSLDSL
ncbi:TetR/AcrR family transcriptional regulator [Brevibacterium sp. UCMA 11754]|nr:TetR/AcrR family transcriptional regulator [Brevibacterium sp. UCMA 11754]